MIISLKQLRNLPVYTKNNDYLGRIKEVEINSETQAISHYLVKNFQVTKKLRVNELLININQVISLDNNRMVVEDNVLQEEDFVREAATI